MVAGNEDPVPVASIVRKRDGLPTSVPIRTDSDLLGESWREVRNEGVQR
jgi:hypothetical protein